MNMIDNLREMMLFHPFSKPSYYARGIMTSFNGTVIFSHYDSSTSSFTFNRMLYIPALRNRLPSSLMYKEETGDHRHFGQGYMASPKVFRMLWLDRRALVESSDSLAGGNNESFRQYQVSMSLSGAAK